MAQARKIVKAGIRCCRRAGKARFDGADILPESRQIVGEFGCSAAICRRRWPRLDCAKSLFQCRHGCGSVIATRI